MVEQVLKLFETVFSKCAGWTSALLNAVDGKGTVMAAFIIVLVIGLLFIPMRGGSLVTDFGTFFDFNQGMIHKGKHGSGKITRSGYRSSYKGKFEQGNTASRTTRRGKHTRYYAGGSGKQGI